MKDVAGFYRQFPWVVQRHGWGRYSGFFFFTYKFGKALHGPYMTREEAEEIRNENYYGGYRPGRVFQVERPVVF